MKNIRCFLTALVLILHFSLCTEEERPALAAKLAEMIRANGNRMTTGFLGTPYILHVLSDNSYTDMAYELLFQEKNPSWLYSVCHGATTMWEHWYSQKEDGTFWSTSMNSFNHYAYGAVFDWIFGVCCGIKTVESAPAYREFTVELEETDELVGEQVICLVFLPKLEYLLNYSKLMLDVEVDDPAPQPPKEDDPPIEQPPVKEDTAPKPEQNEAPKGDNKEEPSSPRKWFIGGGAALLAAVGTVIAVILGNKKKGK